MGKHIGNRISYTLLLLIYYFKTKHKGIQEGFEEFQLIFYLFIALFQVWCKFL